jgi:hypothetical protein
VTAILRGMSPCRKHPCSVEHAELVRGFREHSALWEEQAERETGGYAGDMAAYLETHPRPQFRDWLIHTRKAVQ